MASQPIAFLFPGQGSQTVGMGKELAAAHPAAAEVFAEADRVLGFPLSRLMWEGPAEELNQTHNTQPALLTHSIAVWRALQELHPALEPALAAGHSLGEFSALVAAGSLGFADGLQLVRERGLAMKEAGDLRPGGMAAVLGLEVEAVEAACTEAERRTGEPVRVANDNCPGQVVISGAEGALGHASQALADRGARKVVRLAVSIAAHSPLMVHAQERLQRALASVRLEDPRLPVIGNVGASPLRAAQEIRSELEAQLTSRVRWTESMQRIIASGVTRFFELGPGSVLVGLLRRIDRSVEGLALDEPASLVRLAG
jgi:[acyl-carrier-protein] S-malonyltransferase